MNLETIKPCNKPIKFSRVYKSDIAEQIDVLVEALHDEWGITSYTQESDLSADKTAILDNLSKALALFEREETV